MPGFYPNYSNQYYMQDLQNMRDRIDAQMRQYQQVYNQPQQQAPITQNFQLAPTQASTELEGKYANSLDEVKNTFVIKTGIFVTKDFSTIWVKDVTGNIKTYKTEEVVELDEKDKTILLLQKQINELKGVISNEQHSNSEPIEPITTKKSKGLSNGKSNDE